MPLTHLLPFTSGHHVCDCWCTQHLEELKNVLKDDIKVKVAGEYRLKYGLALGLMLSRNRR